MPKTQDMQPEYGVRAQELGPTDAGKALLLGLLLPSYDRCSSRYTRFLETAFQHFGASDGGNLFDPGQRTWLEKDVLPEPYMGS